MLFGDAVYGSPFLIQIIINFVQEYPGHILCEFLIVLYVKRTGDGVVDSWCRVLGRLFTVYRYHSCFPRGGDCTHFTG